MFKNSNIQQQESGWMERVTRLTGCGDVLRVYLCDWGWVVVVGDLWDKLTVS